MIKFLQDIFPVSMKWTGLLIAIYETLVEHIDRPSLLLLAAGMMGLDRFMKAVGVKKENGA